MSDERPASEEGVVKVTVRQRSGSIVEAIRRLDEAGIGVEDLGLRRPTLDDVFLTLTGHVAEGGEAEREERAA